MSGESASEIDRRVVVDERFTAIDAKITKLQEEMALNTAVTTQVRDILTSFKGLASAAKWVTAIGTAVLMLWHGWQKLTGR